MNKEHDLLHLNFLPTNRSQVASRVVRLRELSLLGFALGLVFLTAVLILATTLVFLNSRLENSVTVLGERQQLQQAAQKDLSVTSIIEQKKNLSVIQSQINDRFTIDPYLVGISQSVENTPSVDIATLKTDLTKDTLRVSGKANTRDGFLAFIDALKKIPGVAEVIYPPGVVFAIEPIVFDVILQL